MGELPLDEWEGNALYICRQPTLTNAKNQALRVLQLIERVRALEAAQLPHSGRRDRS